MKMTFLQLEQALRRAAFGESVRSLAREYGVDESTLREHFRKGGATPKEIRRLAFELFHAQQEQAALDEAIHREVARLASATRRRRGGR